MHLLWAGFESQHRGHRPHARSHGGYLRRLKAEQGAPEPAGEAFGDIADHVAIVQIGGDRLHSVARRRLQDAGRAGPQLIKEKFADWAVNRRVGCENLIGDDGGQRLTVVLGRTPTAPVDSGEEDRRRHVGHRLHNAEGPEIGVAKTTRSSPSVV